MTRDEMEVSISFTDAEKTARMFSSSPRWIRKMDQLCLEHPETFQCTGESKLYGEVVGKFYEFPKDRLFIRPKREVSEEQKEAARERFMAYRQKEEI